MPTQTTRNTLARLWELLKCLPKSGSGKSAQQLSQDLQERGFSVSKRQVERDLHDLSASFSLHCNRAGTPYGWRWASGAQTELAGMDVADLLRLIAESPLSTDQEMEQDTIQATVQDSWELRWWILSQGAGIKVLEPMASREEIAQSLRDACKRYDTPVKAESR